MENMTNSTYFTKDIKNHRCYKTCFDSPHELSC